MDYDGCNGSRKCHNGTPYSPQMIYPSPAFLVSLQPFPDQSSTLKAGRSGFFSNTAATKSTNDLLKSALLGLITGTHAAPTDISV